MKAFFKILLLLIAIFPVWLTIIAFANSIEPSLKWKDAINSKLIEQSTAERKMQVVQFSQSSDDFNEAYLTESFEVKVSDPRARGYSQLELIFNDQEGRLKRVLRVPAKLLIEVQVATATRDLIQGARIQDADIELSMRDAASLMGTPLSRSDAVGREVRNTIKSGSAIYQSNIQVENVVKQGERVRVVVTGNGVRVSSFGIAKQNGKLGETIKVLNPDSKKEIYGTVTEGQLIEVRI